MSRVLLAITLAFSLVARPSAQAQPREIQPESVADNFAMAWNTHDSSRFESLFASDADWVTAKGVKIRGWPSIRAVLEREHSTWAKTTTMTVASTSVRRIGLDDAVLYFQWEIAGAGGSTASALPPYQGVNLLVLSRVADGWRIVAGQVTRTAESKDAT